MVAGAEAMTGPSRTWTVDRTFAFGLLTALIVSIVTQGFIAIQWGRDRERFEATAIAEHIFSNIRLDKLEERPIAAADASQRISRLEERWRFIEGQLATINSKIDKALPPN